MVTDSVEFHFYQSVNFKRKHIGSIFIQAAIQRCSFATKYPQTFIIFEALGKCKPLPRLDRDPNHYQNLITCFFCHPGPLHKISLQSIHNIMSNVANRRKTGRQTNNKQTNENYQNVISLAEIQNNIFAN